MHTSDSAGCVRVFFVQLMKAEYQLGGTHYLEARELRDLEAFLQQILVLW